MHNEVEYKAQYYFEVSVTICVFMWPVITITLLVLTNLQLAYVVRNLLMQAQDRKIGSAISNDPFGLNNQKFSKVKKGHEDLLFGP